MLRIVFLVMSAILACACPAGAVASETSNTCQAAVADAERAMHIPLRLLDSISKVESGRPDDAHHLMAWPWTINAQGQGYFYESKEEAIAAAHAFLAHGINSIDVGCLQINLHHHPDAFSSLDEAFDPITNAHYGARFLTDLFDRFHAWTAATAAYHSLTPEFGQDYARRVMAVWGQRDEAWPFSSMPASPVATTQTVAYRGRPFAGAAFAPPPHVVRQFNPTLSTTNPSGTEGRSLAAYRLSPTRLAWQR
ncbi:hypothetical protein A0U93_02075 [Neoasaia chiangmaiensis]|uniref:Transglycosylase SLT domain-containing protein n=2 Tax=Neoasaia chiangmaiensis TaxID=320497 RepID=A0A1U9KMB1_9PROT|nr:lytic transglycosylase domain-containing protein [Neoasaia chiangmaiensis]AQS86931.1 hypothetical protein A0U93_02075 [Neoasaia chiangmaiensis]